MTRPSLRQRAATVEEYLELEKSAEMRHEFVNGELYALAGASKRHNRIALNIARRLGNAGEGGACRVYASDVRLRAEHALYYYPDVMVACGAEGVDPLVEAEPCLVVEVASPPTAAIDRREKLAAYKRIPTLRAYVIVDQDRRRLERHWRDAEGKWWREELAGEGPVHFPCPETEISLSEIYAGVSLPATM